MNIGDLEAVHGFDPLNLYDAYASWTDSVAKYPPTAEPFYLALGIADESGELVAATLPDEVLKEGGDVLWYCARYSVRVLRIPFSMMIDALVHTPRGVWSEDAMKNIGTIAGVEKKRIRDGEMWDDAKLAAKQREARNAVVQVLAWVRNELNQAGFTIADAIEANQGKLNKRAEDGTLRGDGDNR